MNVTEFTNSRTHEASVADAFRSPAAGKTSEPSEGLRLRVHDLPIAVQQVKPTGWAKVWAIAFPDATIVQISGRINVTLKIYPTNVHIDDRRWDSPTSVLARYNVTIPVYDEVGDSVVHQLRVRSSLAFLYPFVPMHVQVAIDDEVIFGQGKYES